jgi:hypothetical protein
LAPDVGCLCVKSLSGTTLKIPADFPWVDEGGWATGR